MTGLLAREPEVLALPGRLFWAGGFLDIRLKYPLPLAKEFRRAYAENQRTGRGVRRLRFLARRWGIFPSGRFSFLGPIPVNPVAEWERLRAAPTTAYPHGPNSSDKKERLSYQRRTRFLRTIRGVYDSVRVATTASGLWNRRRNALKRSFARSVVEDPDQEISWWREVASDCRDYFMEQIPCIPDRNPRSTWVTGISRKSAGQFSYLKRSLPCYYRDSDAPLAEFKENITRPSTVTGPIRAEFTRWIEEWVDKYSPVDLPRPLAIGPSTGSSFGASRPIGGQRAIYGLLSEYGQALAFSPHSAYEAVLGGYRKSETKPSYDAQGGISFLPGFRKIEQLWNDSVLTEDGLAQTHLGLELGFGDTGLQLPDPVYRESANWVSFLDKLPSEDCSPDELYSRSCGLYHFMVFGSFQLLKRLQIFGHAAVCLGECKDPSRHLPVLPLVVKERGGKTRIPTLTFAAVQVLANILRKVANLALFNDPRTRASLTDKPLRYPKQSRKGWRSQDLSVATDNHAFWFGRVLYNAMLDRFPEIQWLRPVIPVLFGPLGVVEMKREDLPILPLNLLPDFWPTPCQVSAAWAAREELDPEFPLLMGKTPMRDLKSDTLRDLYPSLPAAFFRVSEYEPEEAAAMSVIDWIVAIRPHLRRFESFFTRTMCSATYLTRRGAMMGIPTSWAVLPLVTLFSFEKALGDPVVGDRYKVPKGAMAASTCGDDAVMQLTPEESDCHTGNLISLDAVPSPTKDAYTPYPNGPTVYLEELRRRGRPTGYSTLAPVVGSPGVAMTNWVTAPGSMDSQFEKLSVPTHLRARLYNSSPFCAAWKYIASCWGVPVDLHRELGGLGIGYVHCPMRNHKPMIDLISWYYASLNSYQFFNADSRLSLLPSQQSKGLRWAKRAVWDDLFHLVEEFDGSGIPDEDAWLVLATPYFSAEIFSGESYYDPPQRPLPSLSFLHFWRKVVRPPHVPRYNWKAEELLFILKEKHSRWQLDPFGLPRSFASGFGLTLPSMRTIRFDVHGDPSSPWQPARSYRGGASSSIPGFPDL